MTARSDSSTERPQTPSPAARLQTGNSASTSTDSFLDAPTTRKRAQTADWNVSIRPAKRCRQQPQQETAAHASILNATYSPPSSSTTNQPAAPGQTPNSPQSTDAVSDNTRSVQLWCRDSQQQWELLQTLKVWRVLLKHRRQSRVLKAWYLYRHKDKLQARAADQLRAERIQCIALHVWQQQYAQQQGELTESLATAAAHHDCKLQKRAMQEWFQHVCEKRQRRSRQSAMLGYLSRLKCRRLVHRVLAAWRALPSSPRPRRPDQVRFSQVSDCKHRRLCIQCVPSDLLSTEVFFLKVCI